MAVTRCRAWVLVIALCALVRAATAQPIIEEMEPIEPPTPVVAPDDQTPTTEDAPPPPPAPAASDEVVYPVSSLRIEYMTEHPGLPATGELESLEVELVARNGTYAAAREGEAGSLVRIDAIGRSGPRALAQSGLLAVQDRIVRHLSDDLGILGVLVAPDIDQIEISTGDDLRAEEDTSIKLVVYVGVVTKVRTVASGSRIKPEDRLDNPAHARIARLSPVQAGEDAEPRRDLILRDPLDDYVLRLNRHPGRRVDVALAPGDGLNEATLDYLVAENKPWLLYAQLSNTGTESTAEWRQRFGAQNTQLFNRDDHFSLEYITAGFSESHAVIGSYEFPVGDSQRLRARGFGNYSSYTASDVGAASELFTGEQYELGGELIYNIYQRREFFVDLHAGARWDHIQVSNHAVDVHGDEELFIPRFGVSAEKRNERWSVDGGLFFDFSDNDWTGASVDGMERLGRLDPDGRWSRIEGQIGGSFFLEPIFFGDDWKDPTSWKSSTLAHEIAWSLRGQWAMDNRLIPNEEQVLGGLYTVRGYPESAVAGDSVIAASLEYRWHIPRSFEPDANPTTFMGRQFHASPATVYSSPDWDLALKAFTDLGRTYNSDRKSFEHNDALWGAGLGVDFLLYRNISIRVDWGVALDDVESEDVHSGDSRWHFVFTLLF